MQGTGLSAWQTRMTLSDELFIDMVKAGLSAPTGDNCQPFQFGKSNDEIFVYHNASRGRHFYNPNYMASWLAVGCAIEAMKVAAEGSGYSIGYSVVNEDMEGNAPVVKVWLVDQISPNASLRSALESRFTERRAFLPSELSGSESNELLNCSHNPNATIHLLASPAKELVDFIAKTDALSWKHKRAHSDLFRWLRFSRKEVMATLDGMPATGLGIDFFQIQMLKLCKAFSIQRLFNLCGFIFFTRMHLKRLVKSSAALVCISVKGSRANDLLEAGRMGMNAWLYLTSRGYAVQPLSIPAMFSFAWRNSHLPKELVENEVNLFSSGHDLLKKSFGCAEEYTPVWLFRTGRGKPFPTSARTMRIKVEDAIIT